MKNKITLVSFAMKTLILVAVLFFGTQITEAQPAIQWEKCLGGSAFDGWRTCVQQVTNGGYIIVGTSQSNDDDVTGNHGDTDYWVVKLDSSGAILWEKSLGGSLSDFGYSIQQTTDGGYIIAGYSSSNNGNVTGNHGAADYWLVKIDSIGDIQWEKSFGGSVQDVAMSIQQTSDAGYIVTGESYSDDGDVIGHHGSTTYSDYWILKIDSIGNIQWQKSLGGSGDDGPGYSIVTTDGGYVVAGYSNSTDGDVTGNHGGYDYWVVKLNTNGNIQWEKTYGGSGDDYAFAIQQTTDGGYVVAGETYSTDGDVTHSYGNGDYWIVKLDTVGNIVWQKSLGGTSNDEPSSIQQTSDGGYVVSGMSMSNDYDVTGHHGDSTTYDYWIVKLDSIGNIQWEKSLGGSNNDYTYSDIQQTPDDGYIVSGYSQSSDGDVTGLHPGPIMGTIPADYWVVKLSCGTSIYNRSNSDTAYINTLASIDTLVTMQIDTITNAQTSIIVTTTDSIFVTTHINTTKIITDSVVFTVQCPNVDSVIYADTVSTSNTEFDTVIHESFDTANCPITTYSQVSMHRIDTNALVSISTAVAIATDTLIGSITKVVTITDTVFISTYLSTVATIRDSIVFSVNQCNDSTTSIIYADTVESLKTNCDTVIHQSSDTTTLLNAGLENIDLPLAIKVYPNPFHAKLNVDVGDEVATIALTDALGRMIMQAQGTGHVVLQPNVLSGVYFLSVISKNEYSVTIKVIAE